MSLGLDSGDPRNLQMLHIALSLPLLSSKPKLMSLLRMHRRHLKRLFSTDGFQLQERHKCQTFSGKAALLTFFGRKQKEKQWTAYRKSPYSMISLMILNGPRFKTKIETMSTVIVSPHSATRIVGHRLSLRRRINQWSVNSLS